MLTEEALNVFFDKGIQGWKDDAASKNQKFPQDFRKEIDKDSGKLFGASHIQYLIKETARGPGKMPPLENILEWAKKVPLENRSRKNGRFISYNQLAFAVAKYISLHGTQIFQGKKPGLDFLGVIEKNLPDLVKVIAQNELINIRTNLASVIKTLSLVLLLSSCSATINLTEGQKVAQSQNKFSRYKLSPSDVILYNVSIFGGTSIGYQLNTNYKWR